MQSTWNIMVTALQSSKESGSYILFYLLSLGLGLTVAWDRYGKSKMEDNWMVEENKKKIQLWPFLYGILAGILVVANPISIYLLDKLIPISNQYFKIWPLFLMLFLIAYGITRFVSILREERQKIMFIIGCSVLIGLSGSNYGITAERQEKSDIQEELEILEIIEEKGEGITLLATDSITEYAGIYYPTIPLLYGKDLYTPMDLGIIDTYPAEWISLYESMKNPKENLEEITDKAATYACDIIVLRKFENSPKQSKNYKKTYTTEHYIIYER